MRASSPPCAARAGPRLANSVPPCPLSKTATTPSRSAPSAIPTSPCSRPSRALAPSALLASSSPSANNGNALPPPLHSNSFAGSSPVTERSGKPSWGHWRFHCPTFLRQTFVEWAAESIRHAFWARVYYQQQRDQGKAHQAAVRALAFKWLRILFRCWQDRTPYDASVYLNALNRRGSAPAPTSYAGILNNRKKTLTAPLRACVW